MSDQSLEDKAREIFDIFYHYVDNNGEILDHEREDSIKRLLTALTLQDKVGYERGRKDENKRCRAKLCLHCDWDKESDYDEEKGHRHGDKFFPCDAYRLQQDGSGATNGQMNDRRDVDSKRGEMR